jgi:hypothetical protein
MTRKQALATIRANVARDGKADLFTLRIYIENRPKRWAEGHVIHEAMKRKATAPVDGAQ